MAKVYVIQHPTRSNDGRAFDFSAAEVFGDVITILGPNDSAFAPIEVKRKLHRQLARFTDDDYLICMGNPVLIGMAYAIAAKYNNGNVRALQWSSREALYMPLEVKALFG